MPFRSFSYYFCLLFLGILLGWSCNRVDDDDANIMGGEVGMTGTIDTTGMTVDSMGVDSIETIKYLALGDSYTIGHSIDTEMNYPNQLRDSLGGYPVDSVVLSIIARTGWTINDLIDAIESKSPEPHDVVSLLIGVNNQALNQSFSVFQVEFKQILQISIDLAGGAENVFVISIPDYGVTPSGSFYGENISEEIDLFNAFIKEECDALQIPFIDVTSISRELGDSDGALASDNLHASAEQYSLWVQEMIPAILPIFEAQ